MARKIFNTQKTSEPSKSNPAITPETIQKKAYELFQKRGCSHGNDMTDWLEAEKMLKSCNC